MSLKFAVNCSIVVTVGRMNSNEGTRTFVRNSGAAAELGEVRGGGARQARLS